MSLFMKLRKNFLMGIVVSAPISITVYAIMSLSSLADKLLQPLISRVSGSDALIPGLGIFSVIVMLTLLGAIANNLFGRTFLRYGEKLVNRMPIVRNIYNVLKQIFQTIFSPNNTTFKKVGLIQFPNEGTYALVFLASAVRGEIQDRISPEEDLVAVFLPTAPNPTSGFLLILPRREVQILEMTVEQAIKTILSAGIILPKSKGLSSVRGSGGDS